MELPSAVFCCITNDISILLNIARTHIYQDNHNYLDGELGSESMVHPSEEPDAGIMYHPRNLRKLWGGGRGQNVSPADDVRALRNVDVVYDEGEARKIGRRHG